MKNTILILTILLTFVSCDTEVKSELQTGIIEGEDAKSLAIDGFNDAYLANDMTGQDALFTQDAVASVNGQEMSPSEMMEAFMGGREFYDNIDPINFEKNFQNINFELTGFLVISKSGTTPETLSQFSCLYQKAIEANKVDAFFSNTLIITEFKESPLFKIAKDNNCLLLEHHKDVGGRYSIFTNVGIVPAIISGLNIDALFGGASEVINNIDNYRPYDLGRYLTQKENVKFTNNVLMTYSDSLYFFGKWYLQLWAESIGKNNKGITAIHSVGTTDQHSQLQLYLDGPKDKYFTFITTDHSNKGIKINNDMFEGTAIDYFKDKTMGDLMEAEQRATIETFKLNNFSFREIYIPKIDEKNLGKLLSFSIIETIASCMYLDVDPFDQPAVEQGKKLTKTYLR